MRNRSFSSVIIAAILSTVLFSCSRDDDPPGTDPNDNWPSDSIRVLKSGLNFPWEISWGKDDHLWMTERGGRVSRVEPRSGQTLFSITLDGVVARGEGGLLGMVQDPGFTQNGWIYFVHNYLEGDAYREKLVRYRYNGSALVEPNVLLDKIPAANIHNGSRLVIVEGSPNVLYMTTGDASSTALAQESGSLAGKVLRLLLDGSVPGDNPVAGNYYWSLGHRNPQGLVWANNKLYASEHGPNIEDEINIIEKGRNYGWPSVNGPCDPAEQAFCDANQVKEPIWSSGSSTVAACGLDYYGSDRIPGWKNSLLMTSLKNATLFRHQLNAEGTAIQSTEQLFRTRWGRLRDVCVSPAGRVYLCTSNGNNQDILVEISSPE